MPQVKWWIANKAEAAKMGKRSRYIEANLTEVLTDWGVDSTTAEKTDVKFVKVTFGKTNFIEFNLYSSENYTRLQNKMYKNEPILHDRYQLVIASVYLKRKNDYGRLVNAETANAMLDAIKYLGVGKPKPRNWLDLDGVNELIMQVDEVMECLEEYEVMDVLSADSDVFTF